MEYLGELGWSEEIGELEGLVLVVLAVLVPVEWQQSQLPGHESR